MNLSLGMPLGVLLLLAPALAPSAPAAPEHPMVPVWRAEWPKTDFSKTSVDLSEIISGGPPKDGIPPIDHPKFVSGAQADAWVGAEEPVLVFAHGGVVRAYPLQVLMWHEIVNDTVGGKPVVITFCPLCNSGLVFERRVKGRVLDFGTTGKLRHSDLVMWDRQTESWWQQLTGTAIVGAHTGTRLTFLPAPLVAYGTFRRAHPEGEVLSRDTGFARRYGVNPYTGYDAPGNRPFLLKGELPGRLPAMERVVALEVGGQAKAYPYGELAKVGGVVNDTVAGRELVVWHRGGARSALDGAEIRASRDVGAAVVFRRTVEGRRLTFAARGEAMVDRETGSSWDFFGRAFAGPLKGKALAPVVHGNPFAFAWLVFRPETTIWKAP